MCSDVGGKDGVCRLMHPEGLSMLWPGLQSTQKDSVRGCFPARQLCTMPWEMQAVGTGSPGSSSLLHQVSTYTSSPWSVCVQPPHGPDRSLSCRNLQPGL